MCLRFDTVRTFFPDVKVDKKIKAGSDSDPAFLLCAEHVRQLGGESPLDNLMDVKS